MIRKLKQMEKQHQPQKKKHQQERKTQPKDHFMTGNLSHILIQDILSQHKTWKPFLIAPTLMRDILSLMVLPEEFHTPKKATIAIIGHDPQNPKKFRKWY